MPLHSAYNSENKNIAGTAEANVIYRNLFRNTGDEHWVIGYRYTYNPDVRHYYQTNSNLLGNERRTKRKTNGGLHKHSLSVDLLGRVVIKVRPENQGLAGDPVFVERNGASAPHLSWRIGHHSQCRRGRRSEAR